MLAAFQIIGAIGWCMLTVFAVWFMCVQIRGYLREMEHIDRRRTALRINREHRRNLEITL